MRGRRWGLEVLTAGAGPQGGVLGPVSMFTAHPPSTAWGTGCRGRNWGVGRLGGCPDEDRGGGEGAGLWMCFSWHGQPGWSSGLCLCGLQGCKRY